MTTTSESVRVDRRKVIERVSGRFYLSADQLNLTDNTWTKVALNTTSYDLGKNFVSASNRFVIPVTGLYRIDGVVLFTDASVVALMRYGAAIYKNNAAIKTNWAHASLVNGLASMVADEVYLAKDDYIELFANANAGVSTVDIASGSGATALIVRLLSKEGVRQ